MANGRAKAQIALEAILQSEGFMRDLKKLSFAVQAVMGEFQDGSEAMAELTQQHQEEFKKGMKDLGVKMGAMGAVATALLTQLTMVASRNEELGIVIQNTGKNIGKTSQQMQAYEDAIKSMGITTSAARQSMLQMVQSNVDLAHATDLARLAQDAAVIGQRDSSEAFQYLIQVIQQADTQMARSLGLVVDFQGAYKNLAKELGIGVKALTDEQMAQARVNEVMRAGVNIAGTYEAAMTSAGKKMRSMARHVEELQAKLGSALLPVMGFLVDSATAVLKALNKLDPLLTDTVIQLSALGAASLTVGGAFLTVLPQIAAGIGFITGGIGLLVVTVLAIVAAIAAAVIAWNNWKKAQQEASAEILEAADSYDLYVRKMQSAGKETHILSEELYDLAKAAIEAGEAINLVEFQKQAEGLEKFARHGINTASAMGLLDTAMNDMSLQQDLQLEKIRGQIGGMSDLERRMITGTDAVRNWAIANNKSVEEAEAYQNLLRGLVREVQMTEFVLSDLGDEYAEVGEKIRIASREFKDQHELQYLVQASAQALGEHITAVADALNLSIPLVKEMMVVWGYTDKEMEAVAADFQLTGKELHDLTKETGLARTRILELNESMSESDIKAYGKDLEDAAKATGKSTTEIDKWAEAQGDAAKAVKVLLAALGQLEQGLEDATEKFKAMVDAYMVGLGDIRSATDDITNENKRHETSVSDLRQRASEDIDKIKQKYDNMLPDATTAEQRLANAGQAWDEWAHRALGSIDDVVSGDEEGWIAHIREHAEGAGIIQGENESLYDYMHRVVKAFYENKIPGLIQTSSSQYQNATAEYKALMDEEIRKAEEARDGKIAAAAEEHARRQELNRQERDKAALGAALGIAEADKSLQEFAQQKWPGALGKMFSTAEGFQRGVEQGFIDLNDPQIIAFLTDPMTELRYLLGETKAETEDNIQENRELWKLGGEGAKEMTEEIQAQKDALDALRQEEADLQAQRGTLAQFGEVDPELETNLKNVQDQIKDLEDELDDGPIENMPDDVKTAAEEVDAWTEALAVTKDLLITLGTEAAPGVDLVRTSTEGAITQTDLWSISWEGLALKAGTALDDVNEKLKEMDDSVINITIKIETEGSPLRPTLEVVNDIHAGLSALPREIGVEISLTGVAGAVLSGQLDADVNRAGKYLSSSLWRVVMTNAAKHGVPWRPPFWAIERAGELGGVGSFFADLLEEDVLQKYEELNEQIEETQDLLSDPSFLRQLSYGQYLEILRQYNGALEERNALEDEYNRALEAKQRLEEATARVELLKTQLDFIDLLYDRDIDVRPILKQIGVGIEASSEDWVNAMAIAMEQLAKAAEQNLRQFLGIHSRSEVMYQLGQEMKQGWYEGWSAPPPRMIPGAGQAGGGTTIEVSNDFSGTVINSGLDMAMFQALILQTVRRSTKGY